MEVQTLFGLSKEMRRLSKKDSDMFFDLFNMVADDKVKNKPSKLEIAYNLDRFLKAPKGSKIRYEKPDRIDNKQELVSLVKFIGIYTTLEPMLKEALRESASWKRLAPNASNLDRSR